MNQDILVDCHQGVLRLVINRAEKKNALTADMYRALAAGISKAKSNPEVRVIYITGVGDSFTAGNDLVDFVEASTMPTGTDQDQPVMGFLEAISQARKPVVAGVNGLAIGIGVTLLLHCDLVYASDNALFQMPFINLGLVPEAASSYLLPKIIGLQKASDLLLTGRKFDAREAESLGLVAEVFPADSLRDEAYGRATAVARLAPNAVAQTKRLLRLADAEAVASRMKAEMALFNSQLRSAEGKEGVQAFLEKRPAQYSAHD